MKGLCLILWMLVSLIFVMSIIGLLMFIPKDTWQNAESVPSTWYTIGKELMKAVTK